MLGGLSVNFLLRGEDVIFTDLAGERPRIRLQNVVEVGEAIAAGVRLSEPRYAAAAQVHDSSGDFQPRLLDRVPALMIGLGGLSIVR